MDIKEIGACAVVVIGGVTYAISSGGLKDALTDDIRHVTEVVSADRTGYMNDIVSTFSKPFDAYIVQIETYDYVGHLTFSASPSRAMFIENVTSEEPVPSDAIGGLNDRLQAELCAQEEMTTFTEKGWNYSFKLTDSTGRRIFTTICRGTSLSVGNNAVS